jgi:hypothetical protein
MKTSPQIIENRIRRKLVTIFLITVSIGAFATLGDGGSKKKISTRQSILTHKSNYDFKYFSLKTGYDYRGSIVFSKNKIPGQYFMLNTVITYQKGNTTYILPMKKKLLLDKIKFNPAPLR